jgi:hypothetical protein
VTRIEDVIEGNFGTIGIAVFTRFDEFFGFTQSPGVDKRNLLLFRRWVEEAAIHNESLFKELTRYPDLTKAVKKSTTCGPHLPPGDSAGTGGYEDTHLPFFSDRFLGFGRSFKIPKLVGNASAFLVRVHGLCN